MADRHASSSRTLSSGISKARGMSSTSHYSVRRNLFQSQLTRRPTAPAAGPPACPADALHLDADAQIKDHSRSFQLPLESPSQEDIVVRDKNGEIQLGDPPTPPIDDTEELMALDARHENERERQRLAEAVKQHQIGQNSVVVPAQPEGKSGRLLLSVNEKDTSPVGVHLAKTEQFASTTELLEAVRASLRAKVAALAEDNWMFEREELPHHQ